MTIGSWLALLVLSLLWGGSFFFTGVAVKELPPLTIVISRVALAALALQLVAWLSGHRMPRSPRIWFALAGMALLNNLLPFTLIVWGQTHIASGLASILNATTPLFAIVIAHLATRDERLTLLRLTGVVIGFGGVVIVIGPAALSGWGVSVLAQLAILGAAFSYACAGVFGRRFAAWGITPLVAAAGQVTVSALVMLPVALWVDRPWQLSVPGLEIWGAVAGLAFLSTALAYVLYFRILASAGATNILLVTFLIPVSAILLGALFLNEQLATQHFVGIGVIGLALAVIDGRWFKRRRSIQRRSVVLDSANTGE